MAVDTLHSLVTAAIWRAEQLGELGIDTAKEAWAEVSALEERLAAALPGHQAEGRIARRGAVRAALKAGDYDRSRDLLRRFVSEVGVQESLAAELDDMLSADARELGERFPRAMRQVDPAHIRELAAQIRRGGAFGLAA